MVSGAITEILSYLGKKKLINNFVLTAKEIIEQLYLAVIMKEKHLRALEESSESGAPVST